jgi:hypothetical protein
MRPQISPQGCATVKWGLCSRSLISSYSPQQLLCAKLVSMHAPSVRQKYAKQHRSSLHMSLHIFLFLAQATYFFVKSKTVQHFILLPLVPTILLIVTVCSHFHFPDMGFMNLYCLFLTNVINFKNKDRLNYSDWNSR